jgi:LysM repeat protein
MKPKEDEVITKAEPVNPQQQNKTLVTASRTTEPVFVEQPQSGPVKSEMKIQENNVAGLKSQAAVVTSKPDYPTGEFKINETRVIFAKKGTPLLAIAQQYNISLSWLYDFNDLPQTESLEKDQLVYLQRKRKTGKDETHIVKPGESLYDIAQQEAIRLESLLEYNMLTNEMQPAIGEQLYLRVKAPSRPKLALKENYSLTSLPEAVAMNANTVTTFNSQSNSGYEDRAEKQNTAPIVYIVQPKETIWAIAQKYKVSVDALVTWNQLQAQDLKAGQRIKIYK